MIAVLGAGGQLGTAFVQLLGDRAIGITRSELDITRPEMISRFVSDLRPLTIINCAAYTAVDRAEVEPVEARLVNATAVGWLAAAAAEVGAGFVTFSTDYVFGGTATQPYVESDQTDPVNVYGATKLEGEALAVAAHPRSLVVRTSWLLSGTHPNFITTILKLAREGSVQVVDDQWGNPTFVDDLSRATMAAVDQEVYGVLHLTNTGPTTWYRLARNVVEIAGLDPDRITACTSEEYPRPAPRPAYSVLGSERLIGLGLDALPSWDRSIVAAIDELGRHPR